MDYAGLLTIGGALFDHLGAPDAPNVKPFSPDPIESKDLSEYLPEIDKLMSQQADIAISMMKGELPSSVVDQVKMFAGEAAQRGGYGSTVARSGNLAARDLGLSALDMMETGQQYAGYLVNQARNMRADDLDVDISNVNMAFDAWASNAQISMDNWRGTVERRSNLISNVTGGLATLFESD